MESRTTEVTSDLADLTEVSLSEMDEALDETPADDTLRRVAPDDGSRLLVAAAFNSAI